VSLVAFSVRGEVRTWIGGGGDAKWSTPANWGGTAPAANDTLVFSGTTQLASTNDLAADTPIAGIIFNSDAGAFTLGGNRIALDGPVSNLSASAQTFSLGMALTGTRVFDASNGAVTVNGSLSGAGGLTKTGPQALTLSASNSYDGVTTVNNGILLVTHGDALGSTNGNTVVKAGTGGYLQLSGGITVPEPLYLDYQRPNALNQYIGESLLNISGTNTLTGPITCSRTRIYLSANTKLVFTGGLTNLDGYLIFSIPATSSVELSGLPVKSPNNLLYLLENGLLVANTPDNVWSRIEVRSSMTFRTDLKNTLPADSQVYLHLNTSTLNLNGYDQTVAGIYNNCYGVIRSDTPATLTVNQAGNSLHRGQLNGAVSLFKDGAGTLILSNTTSTTTGDITVTNGTLVAALTKSIGNSTNITVSGGTLDLRAPAMIPDAARLSISGDGTVAIGDGIVETVSDFFVNGVQQKSGTWGSTASGADHIDDTHFSGNGVLFVQHSPPFSATEATWDGEGTDALLNTEANWQGDTLPLFDGATRALFGTGGATATVDTAANLYGITFNRAGDFTLAAGDGALTLGAGGIAAASPDTTSRTYTINADVTLSDNATWSVATNGTGMTSLSIQGAIGDGSDTYGFTKTGAGTLLLSGANTYDGITTVDNGMMHITHGNALGSTRNNTVVNAPSGGYLQLSGNITVPEPIYLNWQRNDYTGTPQLYALYNLSGSNTLAGEITCFRTRIHLAGATTLVFEGGLTNIDGFVVMDVPTASSAIFRNKPVQSHTKVMYLSGAGQYIFQISGNVWGKTAIIGNGTVRTEVPDALPPAATLEFSTDNGKLDLNGKDQTIAGIIDVGKKGFIQSETPATLTVNQNDNTTFAGRLTGAVNLLKTGSGTLTLSNNLSTTTGDITVSEGTLAVALENSLGNSTNITVSGAAARLELRASSGIADTAALKIANDGAKVNLLAGVGETVGWLYLGGKMQRAGTYGSASSGAIHKDATHFSGTGILTVLHDQSGTLVSVR